MNDQKFKMWRLALSLIHVDGKVSASEEKWFHEKVKVLSENKTLDFTSEQISELDQVLHSPVKNIINELEELTNPADSSFLLHILGTISHLDGNYCEHERDLYQQMETAITKGVNIAQLKDTVRAMEQRSYQQPEPEGSLLERVFWKIARLINKDDN